MLQINKQVLPKIGVETHQTFDAGRDIYPFFVLVASALVHLFVLLLRIYSTQKKSFIYEFFVFLCTSLVFEIIIFRLRSIHLFRVLHIVRFLILFTITRMTALHGHPAAFLLYITLFIETALYESMRGTVIINIFFTFVLCVSLFLNSMGIPRQLRPEYLLYFVFFSVLITAVSTISIQYRERIVELEDRIDSLNSTIVNLADANKAFQLYSKNLEDQSAEKERNRITRELHDTVGYVLTNIIVMMNAGKVLLQNNPKEFEPLLDKVREQTEKALTETRSILYRLREIRHFEHKGLRAIFDLVKSFEGATGITIELSSGNMPASLGHHLDSILFRLVQEGLTNAFRHGIAKHIWINMWITATEIRIVIWDNGKGTGGTEIEKGIGLSGIQERFSEIGGTVTAGSVIDGFMLSAVIPYIRGGILKDDTGVNS